eukprot:6176486-Pleurochrysis_carterae.AAC.5
MPSESVHLKHGRRGPGKQHWRLAYRRRHAMRVNHSRSGWYLSGTLVRDLAKVLLEAPCTPSDYSAHVTPRARDQDAVPGRAFP